MTPVWWSVVTAVTFVLASQAYQLREFGVYGLVMYTGGPSLMTLVMAALLLVTGTSVGGTTAACVAGCVVQLVADRVRVRHERRREARENGEDR